MSDNGGAFTPWLTHTSAGQATFYAAAAGRTYGFFSVGGDWAGNEEGIKFQADANTRTAARVIGNLNDDGLASCNDLSVIRTSFGRRSGGPGFDPRADVHSDGVVDIHDLAWEARQLPPGSLCQ